MPSFLLCISQSLILFVEVVDVLEKRKAELQELPLSRAVFLEGVKREQYQ